MPRGERPWRSLFRLGIGIHHFNKQNEKQLGLSLVQWCVLEQLIDMPGTTAFALAHAVGVHPSSLTQSLKRLERKKYVYATEDPVDSRKKLVSITKKGKEIFERVGSQMMRESSTLCGLRDEFRRVDSFLQSDVFRATVRHKTKRRSKSSYAGLSPRVRV